jgi:sec-independent protein translocase protein TatB
MKAMGSPEMLFILFLALIIFGPKKLPEIARQIGKVMNEFKRASNEFRSQIETEISQLEVEEQQKKRQILPPAEPPRGAVAALSGVVLPPEPAPFAEPDSAGQVHDA